MSRPFMKLAYSAVIALACCAALHAQSNPPRIEIGAVLSSAKQTPFFDDYHVGGGARFAVNATVEVTRQPTGNPYYKPEWHTAIS